MKEEWANGGYSQDNNQQFVGAAVALQEVLGLTHERIVEYASSSTE